MKGIKIVGRSAMGKDNISLVLVFALTFVVFSSSAYAALGDLLFEWGSYGDGDGQFSYPIGVECDANGNVYVADFRNWRVQVFNRKGQFISSFFIKGPVDIAIDSAGFIYVTSFETHQVFVYNSNGVLTAIWGRYYGGSEDGNFYYPAGIAIDEYDYVYVADSANSRVQVFDIAGNFITKWGSEGWGDGQFARPAGIAVDANYVYVVDSNNYRVQVFDKSGAFVTKWGEFGQGDGQFDFPWGIALDGEGHVFVAAGSSIQVFNLDGLFIRKWSAGALGISFVGKGRDYVCAAFTGGYMIQVFDGKVKNKDTR